MASSAGLSRTTQATTGAIIKGGTNSLAARFRADLRQRELAAEWLRKGLELYDAAWDDPEWTSVQEFPFPEEEPGPEFETGGLLAKLIKGAEYVHAIQAGGEPNEVARQLEMSYEDQELAHIAYFFMPSTLAEFLDTRSTEESSATLENLARRSSVPMPAGLKSGMPSDAMLERMARLQRGGSQAYSENVRLHSIYQRHNERLKKAFRCFEEGLKLDPQHPELLFRIALAYELGDGVLPNLEQAIPAYKRAADLGHLQAQEHLDPCLQKAKEAGRSMGGKSAGLDGKLEY